MPSFSQVLSQLLTDAGVGGQATVSYATAANLPLSGNTAGDLAIVLDTKAIYVWDGNEWDRIKAGVEESPVFTAEELGAVYSAGPSGTPFTLDATAYDPEGFDITYDYKTHPINQTSATITNNNDGTFTVAPSAVSGTFSLRMLASDGVNTSTRTSVIEVGLTEASYMLGGSLSVIGSDDSVFDGATPLPTVLSNNITTVESNKSQIDAGGEYISIQNIPNMTFNRTAGQMFPVFAVRFDANTAAAIGIVMRNSDNTYQYGIAQNGAAIGFFPNGVSPIQYFSPALALNTWYILTPIAHWGAPTVWRAKQVGGAYINLTNGSNAGYSPPTTTLAGSITFFGADPGIPSAVQGYVSRAAMPHTFGGMALYPVDNFTADEGLAELETILFS